MKKKIKKRIKKKQSKLKKRKKAKKRNKKKPRKIKKKIKKFRKIKKKKITKKRKKKTKIKVLPSSFKKFKIPKFTKHIYRIKNLNFKIVVNFVFQPLFRTYSDYMARRKIDRIKKINLEKKLKEKQIKEEERKIIQIKEKELKDEIKFAKIRSLDLKKFIREEQAILRREQAKRRLAFLQQIKLDKKIESFRKREIHEIKNLEKLALREQREDYRPVEERLEKIKEKYRLIREQKIRERVQTLGLDISDADSKEDLLQKEREHTEYRKKIEFVLESFYRSANSLIFQLNKRYIPKHKSILRVIDRRWETNEMFIRYDDSSDEDWMILIYLEDSNPQKGKIVVENKANPEKYETRSFKTKDIFLFSDYLVDVMTAHIDRERQKKAS